MSETLRASLALATLVAALSLTACGDRHDTSYRCEGGTAITAHLSGSTLRLELPDTTVTLQRAESGDGVRYGTGEYTFWMKDNQAMVQRGDLIIHRNCLAQN